jgi:cell division initiation protein
MSPERVRTQEFSRTPLGRRGYDIEEVRRFLARMAQDVAAADAEKARLRAEIERLKNYFRSRNVDVDNQRNADSETWPNIAAINLMSRAQQAADAQVAQAEDYCRRLVAQATQQYEDILRQAAEEAQQAAERARAAEAEHASLDADSAEREALEQRIAWLHTFADVTRVQLRSMLEALTREVDKLADLPQDPTPPDDLPPESAAADHAPSDQPTPR